MMKAPRLAAVLVVSMLATIPSITPVSHAAEAPTIVDGTIVDDVGRSVTLPPRVDRVFAAGPPAAVLILAVAPEKLIGWPWPLADGARALLPSPAAQLPEVGGLGGRGSTASAETIAALKPDLIVDSGSVDPIYAATADRIQGQTGIVYVLINGHFAETPALLRRTGVLLGKPERGEELGRFAEVLLTGISRRVAEIPSAARPRVYYARGPKGLQTGFKGSINSEIIEFAGGVNAAGDTQAPGLSQVSVEQVMQWDPDVIIAESPAFLRDGLAQEPWHSLRAVRQHRVYLAPSLPFGWLDGPPGINRLIGVAWLAERLYPDRFRFDLPKMTRTFYAEFYGTVLSDAQLATIVEGEGFR